MLTNQLIITYTLTIITITGDPGRYYYVNLYIYILYIYIYVHILLMMISCVRKHMSYDIEHHHTPGLHNKIPANKTFARVWVAQEPICS